jgi:beta-glucanase (GH16 family)
MEWTSRLHRMALITMLMLFFGFPVSAQVFFDDFNHPQLDTSKWKITNTKWGEDTTKVTHGGVIPENVSVKNGLLVIRALGAQYKGPVKGHGLNTRIGGVIYTKERFASGSYEVRAKICPQPGALSAFWTYYYESDTCNHEIDFEFPGHNQAPNKPADSDLRWGLVSSWRGVPDSMRRTKDIRFGRHADGKFHLYRFDWHTGADGETPGVEWYMDNKLIHRSTVYIPSLPSPFWLGIWFPTWIKPANFDTDYMYIDWVKITPFAKKSGTKKVTVAGK